LRLGRAKPGGFSSAENPLAGTAIPTFSLSENSPGDGPGPEQHAGQKLPARPRCARETTSGTGYRPVPSHDTHLRCGAANVFKQLSSAKWLPKSITLSATALIATVRRDAPCPPLHRKIMPGR